jgi:hypothetical protein
MEKAETVNVYCPVCAKLGRKKLLFRCTPTSKGAVLAFCKGCKKEIKIELEKSL